jgi:hypothetical protein
MLNTKEILDQLEKISPSIKDGETLTIRFSEEMYNNIDLFGLYQLMMEKTQNRFKIKIAKQKPKKIYV